MKSNLLSLAATGVVQKLFNISLPLSTNCGSERREANDYQEYSIRLNVDPQPSADGTQGFILVCRWFILFFGIHEVTIF